jgi:hypothetical protein
VRKELREDLDNEEMTRLVNVLTIAVLDAALLPDLNAYYRLYDETLTLEQIIETLVAFVLSGVLRK